MISGLVPHLETLDENAFVSELSFKFECLIGFHPERPIQVYLHRELQTRARVSSELTKKKGTRRPPFELAI